MRTGKVRVWIALAVGAPTLVACTALLGTYEVDPTGSDAGPDAPGPIPAVDTGSDAPVDTGATDAGTEAAAETGVIDAAPKPCGLGDPLETPVQLDINDNGAFDDRSARITPDGQWLLFARRSATNAADPRRIVISKWNAQNNKWGVVRPIDSLNGGEYDAGTGARLASNSEPNFVAAPGGNGGRIFFTSDRLLNGTYQNTDFYYADVKDKDFTQIDEPVRLGTMVNGTVLSTGGQEGWSYILPTGPGAGRWFFARYIAVNHTDMFYTDFNNLVLTPPLAIVDLNLPDQSQEYKPAFGNGVLYFTSSRKPLADGGLERFPPDAGLPNGGYVGRPGGQIWAARLKNEPGTPKFEAPVLISELSRVDRETNITSVSTDGCSIIFSANWDTTAADGRHRLYTVNRKRPQ